MIGCFNHVWFEEMRKTRAKFKVQLATYCRQPASCLHHLIPALATRTSLQFLGFILAHHSLAQPHEQFDDFDHFICKFRPQSPL